MREIEKDFIPPPWLEKKRIPDAWLAEAYEQTPAKCRAAIKTGMAITHFHFGEQESLLKKERLATRLGLRERVCSAPAPWTLLIIHSDFLAAAQIGAAAILPALADANPPLAICLGGKLNAAVFATLELCGIEDIMALTEAECGNLLHELAQKDCPAGRIVFCHQGGLEKFVNLAGKLRFLTYETAASPRLLLLAPEDFDSEILQFCLGKLPETDDQAAKLWDAIYYKPGQQIPKSRLALKPGCEGFWLHPGLNLEFFRNSALDVELI